MAWLSAYEKRFNKAEKVDVKKNLRCWQVKKLLSQMLAGEKRFNFKSFETGAFCVCK